MYWRIANGGEDATETVTTGGNSDELYGWYIRITGVDTENSIYVLGQPYNVGYATSHQIVQVFIIDEPYLAIYALAFDGGDGVPFGLSGSGWAEEDEHQSGSGSTDACGVWGWKYVSSGGGSGAVTVTSNSNDGATAIQIALRLSTGEYPGPTPNAFNKLAYVSEPPTPGAWNKVAYLTEPPTTDAWNKLKYGD